MSAWQSIRLLRARPPAGVTEERLAVFVAALEQAEQLMGAAQAVGASARPLPLFYALSQAGRAIAAARLGGDAWRLAGHGLHEPRDQAEPGDLLRRVIAPRPASKKSVAEGRRDSFAGVAEATGSESLSAETELGAVWAAIPTLDGALPQMPELDPAWRRPLRIYPAQPAVDDTGAVMVGHPLQLFVAGMSIFDSHPESAFNPDDALRELETFYPTSAGVAIPSWRRNPRGLVREWAPTGESLPVFCWPDVQEPVRPEQLDRSSPCSHA